MNLFAIFLLSNLNFLFDEKNQNIFCIFEKISLKKNKMRRKKKDLFFLLRCHRFTYNFLKNASDQYRLVTPSYDKIQSLLYEKVCFEEECNLENDLKDIDHIAFRTFQSDGGIQKVQNILEDAYEERDSYDFTEKHLKAKWFSPKIKKYPRIFVSELIEDDITKESKNIIQKYTKSSKLLIDKEQNIHLFDGVSNGDVLWGPISYEDYQRLADESEYAAWKLVNGNTINHKTIPVHKLDKYGTMDSFICMLEKNGIQITDTPKIKESNDQLLLQATCFPDQMDFPFKEGIKTVSGPNVEFIDRKPLSMYNKIRIPFVTDFHRKEGFEVENANKIFNSTNRIEKFQ